MDDPAFADVGSEMLGGSTYLAPESERHKYISGIRTNVKVGRRSAGVTVQFVGVIAVSDAKSAAVVNHAIDRIRVRIYALLFSNICFFCTPQI
jgi:hypothetical protein